ncbi:MAG: hypothetical protein PVG25_06845 [Anaerolineae bacterium]|jgi:hypothetical protein
MASILRLIGFLSAVFTLVLTVLMLFNFRKERRIGAVSPLLSAAVSLLLLPVFMLLSGARLKLLLGIPILALGLLIGFLRGMATRLTYKDGQVIGRNSMLFLLGWGGSLVLAQLLTLGGSALLASVGLMPMFLSTGTQVGMNGNIFLRRLMMKPPPSVDAMEPGRLGLPEEARAPSRPPSPPERERATSPGPPGLPESDSQGKPPGLPER